MQLLKNVTGAWGYRGYTDTTWGQSVTGQVEPLAFVSLCFSSQQVMLLAKTKKEHLFARNDKLIF